MRSCILRFVYTKVYERTMIIMLQTEKNISSAKGIQDEWSGLSIVISLTNY